jgi:hypothetical protein
MNFNAERRGNAFLIVGNVTMRRIVLAARMRTTVMNTSVKIGSLHVVMAIVYSKHGDAMETRIAVMDQMN